MKKDKGDKMRRLTLSRETLRKLEDPRLLEQVQGGTSQLRVCTSISFNEDPSNAC